MAATVAAGGSPFNGGVQAKNFTAFYESISDLWKSQTTPEKLLEAFNDFIEKKINIAAISNLSPEFDKKPSIGPDGTLALDGIYPTMPIKVHFSVKYTYEQSGWKLIAIKVETKN